ncbi:hypothetical protein UFOVP1383_45 [uncultured Caudovirales phage]|uniref:Uncharacterized protein n=1 Tax=uncultured Caudovirales phage TaxID=2100421 RepID=A0A6J5SMM4_9CAUD|nr:hypothetical protein UFOVP848_55 [uncultured Caudovirales phage]CAB4173018.1 hypothetical protein UFOVP945_10 [uncultured Caudovirales phage]CAB4179647.1 hypothetical protein UFOVP1023_32 [uncultured Caudovirales phage]CAB4204260.1 hypothetical protein UFOVP1383_45 [uncultured Caudovirales phage]CAB4215803.1 hypothetical protein UFOVP1477_3 [uncultured Caudovirales phage]
MTSLPRCPHCDAVADVILKGADDRVWGYCRPRARELAQELEASGEDDDELQAIVGALINQQERGYE